MENPIVDTALILPMLALIGLTILVWFYLFKQRLGVIKAKKIHPESLKTPEGKMQLAGPTNYPAENMINLFEVPILFYVLSLMFIVTGTTDAVTVYLAWGYVGLRTIHSIIQCTYNKIMHRFKVYLVSCLVLFAMFAKAVMAMI